MLRDDFHNSSYGMLASTGVELRGSTEALAALLTASGSFNFAVDLNQESGLVRAGILSFSQV